LLELNKYTREEVAVLMTAVDVALMTSFSEGSPQFVKEALACNCPVVSTDVGDVRAVISSIPSCYITSYAPSNVADKLRSVLNSSVPVATRGYIQYFDNKLIAQQVRTVYEQIR
jgi:teichuronic acid biosynthesis glycosyltransferase TuaC